MAIQEQLKNLIPNPFSRDNNLTDIVKKVELIEGGLSYTSIFNNIFIVFIVAFVLKSLLNLPIQLLVIFIVTELLIILTNFLVIFSKLQAIKAIDTKKDTASYLKILIINEYYNTLKMGAALIESFISYCLIFYIINSDILKLNISSEKYPFILYFFLLIVAVRLLSFLINFIRYKLIKNIKPSNDFAEVNKNYNLVFLQLHIISGLLILGLISLVICVLFLFGFGPYLSAFAIFLIFPILIIIIFTFIDIFTYKRLKKVNFDNQKQDGSVNVAELSSINDIFKASQYFDERILGAIFGISKFVASFKDIFSNTSGSYSFLGTGRNFAPENTLIVTNYRLLFIQVPVSGGDKVIGEIDYVEENFLFNRLKIKEVGEALLKNNSILQLLSFARNEILYKDIKNLTLNKYVIKVEKMSGDKFRYSFLDKDYVGFLDKILPEYLKERLIIK